MSGTDPQTFAKRNDPAATHVPALDGVRGLAILLVLFYHFLMVEGGSPLVRIIQKTWGYGWVGVDLFFVLSGFLITGILLDAKGGPHYFRNFYARRTLRIFPLYYAFLIAFILVLPRIVDGWTALYGRPGGPVWSYFLYVYNFAQHIPHPSDFSHVLGVTWSLCIEEQFYLVWPAIVLVSNRQRLLRICAALILVSIISRAVMFGIDAGYSRISTWTISRMDPLAAGATVALLLRGGEASFYRRVARVIVVTIPIVLLSLNFIGGSLISNPMFLILGYTLIAAMFAALLLLVVTATSTAPIVRVFSNPVLRLLGRLSYAIYLFNQPVKYAMAKYAFDPNDHAWFGSTVPAQLAFLIVGATISTLLALASWHLFEKHFLKLKNRFPVTARDRVSPTETPVENGEPLSRASSERAARA